MSPSTAELIRDSLPLVGVVVGGVLGAWLNTTSETRRWRRQWMFETYREQRDYIGQVLAAVEAQFILLHRFGDAARGRGPVTSQERIRVADDEWRRVLALKGTSAQPDLQHAMTSFDQARSDVVDAVNARDHPGVDASLDALIDARTRMMKSVKTYQDAMTVHLARHVHPLRTRTWRRLRGQTLDYL